MEDGTWDLQTYATLDQVMTTMRMIAEWIETDRTDVQVASCRLSDRTCIEVRKEGQRCCPTTSC